MRKDFEEFKKFIKGKKVGVVGIGVSNVPLIHFLIELGAQVTAFDRKNEDQLGENKIKEFTDLGVKLSLGDGYLDELTGFDVIFKSPSMRIDNPYLQKAKEQGSYITSEIEEFVRYCPAKLFGVTGSDGKTTTTSLIYEMLKTEGYKTWVGGNIGIPLFAEIENITEQDKVVLELSSFQLMTMNLPIDVAVVTNLSPNHLDMHKDMQEYIDSKKNIYLYQNECDLLVLNEVNEITNAMTSEAKGRIIKFNLHDKNENGAYFENNNLYFKGDKICSQNEVKILGIHNIDNLLAAFCAVSEDVSIKSMNTVATTFTGVEHRTEFIKEVNGIKYYNDSIASSPTRTLAGLKGYYEKFNRKVILIAGGYDKNIPFDKLAEEGSQYIKALILVGNTKSKIRNSFNKVMEQKNISLDIYEVDTFEETLTKATSIAEKGDVVTLSPACASFDMFPNFAVRGNRFKELVNELK